MAYKSYILLFTFPFRFTNEPITPFCSVPSVWSGGAPGAVYSFIHSFIIDSTIVSACTRSVKHFRNGSCVDRVQPRSCRSACEGELLECLSLVRDAPGEGTKQGLVGHQAGAVTQTSSHMQWYNTFDWRKLSARLRRLISYLRCTRACRSARQISSIARINRL